MENKYCVYCHKLFDGRRYIGITKQKNPNLRWANGNGYKKNKHFYSAIKKYGWDAFKHQILYKNLSEHEAKSKEIKMIRLYKTVEKKYGFNQSLGGEGRFGQKHSEEEKEKLR